MLGLPQKVIVYGLLALALVAWASWTVHSLKEQGRQEAIQDVENANRASERKAQAGSAAVQACYDRGGAWNRARGLCEHADAGE